MDEQYEWKVCVSVFLIKKEYIKKIKEKENYKNEKRKRMSKI